VSLIGICGCEPPLVACFLIDSCSASVHDLSNGTSSSVFVESSGEFSIYGVVRFTTYMMSATALYLENFQIAAIAFGFGALLGFLRRIARIWE